MARCPSCNKFVGMENQIEVDQDLEMNDTAIEGELRLVRSCSECGEELKQAEFSIEEDISDRLPDDHLDDGAVPEGHDLQVSAHGDPDTTERSEGKGRGMKTFHGFAWGYTIKCSCGKVEFDGEIRDDTQASHFEDLT